MNEKALHLRVLTAAFEGSPVSDLPRAIKTLGNDGARWEFPLTVDRVVPAVREAIEKGEIRLVDVKEPGVPLTLARVDEVLSFNDDNSFQQATTALELTELGEERLSALLAERRG